MDMKKTDITKRPYITAYNRDIRKLELINRYTNEAVVTIKSSFNFFFSNPLKW
jgi:hypothetical protein